MVRGNFWVKWGTLNIIYSIIRTNILSVPSLRTGNESSVCVCSSQFYSIGCYRTITSSYTRGINHFYLWPFLKAFSLRRFVYWSVSEWKLGFSHTQGIKLYLTICLASMVCDDGERMWWREIAGEVTFFVLNQNTCHWEWLLLLWGDFEKR